MTHFCHEETKDDLLTQFSVMPALIIVDAFDLRGPSTGLNQEGQGKKQRTDLLQIVTMTQEYLLTVYYKEIIPVY